jgi:hypothetical protein
MVSNVLVHRLYAYKKAITDVNDSSFYQWPRRGCVGRLWMRSHDTCADKLGVKRNPVGNQAEHRDGTLTSLEGVTNPLAMELGDNERHEMQPYISHAVAKNLILRIVWLYRNNPHINWQRNRLISDDTSTRRR